MASQFGSRSRIVAKGKPNVEATEAPQATPQAAPQATPQAASSPDTGGIEGMLRSLLSEFLGDRGQPTLPAAPSVTTTQLSPAMGTQAVQDAQEQAAIRSASGITESLGRPSPTTMAEVNGFTTNPQGDSGAGVTVGGVDAATDRGPEQGLVTPPAQDTVSISDTSVPIPAEEAEAVTPVADTAATTPTRDELIDSVFDAEGGYSTDRDDTGNYYRGQFVGTNHGISAPVLANHLGRTPTVEDMRGLTQDTAREIAATQYYDTYNISDLPDETQEIVFHAVYMGGSRGVRAIQNLTGSTPDGIMGPNTRTAMQESTFTPQEFRDEYLRELEFGTTGYSSPAATWDVHGRGWSNRYNELAVGQKVILPSSVEPVSLEKVEAATTALAVTEAVSEATPAVAADNPLEYIFNKGFIGLDEKNVKHQSTIAGFINNAVPNFVTKDSQVTQRSKAWCGAFVDHVLENLGAAQLDTGDKYDKLRAAQYLGYGDDAGGIDKAQAGDLVVIRNAGQWHVSFYVGKNEKGEVLALGGNQGNSVKVSAYSAGEVKGVRRIADVGSMDVDMLKDISSDIAETSGKESTR